MVRHEFDFYLLEIESTLAGLSDFLAFIEQEMTPVYDERRKKLKAELEAKGVEWAEAQMELQVLDHLSENVFPRTLRAGFVMTLWGALEGGLTEAAREIGKHQAAKLKLRHLHGGGLERLNSYFRRVLGVPLVDKSADLRRLRDLQIIRNAYAHANGRFAMMSKEAQSQVSGLASRDVGVSIDWGHVVLTAAFAQDSLDVVDRVLRRAVVQARSSRPRKGHRSTSMGGA